MPRRHCRPPVGPAENTDLTWHFPERDPHAEYLKKPPTSAERVAGKSTVSSSDWTTVSVADWIQRNRRKN